LAVPLDSGGRPVDGLVAEWLSQTPQVVSVGGLGKNPDSSAWLKFAGRSRPGSPRFGMLSNIDWVPFSVDCHKARASFILPLRKSLDRIANKAVKAFAVAYNKVWMI
jgi:hypothetical protein